MAALTFLFTDLKDSTLLWDRDPDAMSSALARHDDIVADAVAEAGGSTFKTTGDGVAAVFERTNDAVAAACTAQLSMQAEDWPEGELQIRVGISTGEAEKRGDDYFGSAVNLAARVAGVANPGQTLLSESSKVLLTRLPREVTILDEGDHWLKGFSSSQRLFSVEHPELSGEFPPIGGEVALGPDFPPSSNSFLGRSADIGRLTELVGQGWLVSIVGPGGVGKTRLARELAFRIHHDFPHGVTWCSLAQVTTPDHVVHALASAMEVGGVDDPLAAILDRIDRRKVLIVLDNCEHQLPACRTLVGEIRRHCFNAKIVSTSREPLHIDGEQLHTLQPLALGDEERLGDAAALFVDRARALGVGRDSIEADPSLLLKVCQRLDGLPLALELAAARTRTMTLAELEAALDERFSVLARRPSIGGRHDTMHGTVRWSYDSLCPLEQTVLNRASVFHGGFDLAAAASVVAGDDVAEGEVGDVLFDLTEKSLVQPDTSGASTRFGMLETVRDFAAQRLEERGETHACRLRHLRHYVDVAEEAEVQRGLESERAWVDIELREFANLRAAAGFARETDDLDNAIRLYVSLYELASLQGRVEIFDWFDPADHLDTPHRLLPAAMAMSGLRHDPTNPASLETAELAIAMRDELDLDEHRILSFAKGFAAASRGDMGAAMELYRESAATIRRIEGENGRWINALALVQIYERDPGQAAALVRRARRIGQPSGLAFALLALARATGDSDPTGALDHLIEAGRLAAAVRNRHAQVYVSLAAAELVDDASPEVALRYEREALVNAVALREARVVWRVVRKLVTTLKRVDEEALARRIALPWISSFSGTEGADRLSQLVVGKPSSEVSLFDHLSEHELLESTLAAIDGIEAAGGQG